MKPPTAGDLVMMRSGGPVMTVVSSNAASGQITCVWFRPGTKELCVAHLTFICLTTEASWGSDHLFGEWEAWTTRLPPCSSRTVFSPWIPPEYDQWLYDTDYGPAYRQHLNDVWDCSDIDDADYEDDDDDVDYYEELEREEEELDEELEIDSESFARSEEDGWFYDD